MGLTERQTERVSYRRALVLKEILPVNQYLSSLKKYNHIK